MLTFIVISVVITSCIKIISETIKDPDSFIRETINNMLATTGARPTVDHGNNARLSISSESIPVIMLSDIAYNKAHPWFIEKDTPTQCMPWDHKSNITHYILERVAKQYSDYDDLDSVQADMDKMFA
jgi:hypothetical protein